MSKKKRKIKKVSGNKLPRRTKKSGNRKKRKGLKKLPKESVRSSLEKVSGKAKKHIINRAARVAFGVRNFDKLIEGGFEGNSTNLLVGGSGAGKTIFATQFLVEGMKKGEKCLYITFEEKRQQFFENMKDFGWDLAAYEKKGMFTFLEYSPVKVKTMLEEGGGSIESIILEKKITRLVIDSITSFALLFEDELSRRQAALSLFNMIKGWNCTALLTLEEDPPSSGKLDSRALEFESDSIIMLYFLRDGGERSRFLEIIKMRGTKHSKQIYPFEIAKSGVAVKDHSAKNVFGK